MNLNRAAQLLDDHYPDYFVFIDLAPGEEPTEDELAPGVKKVHHGDAEETLYVEIDSRHLNDGETFEAAAEDVRNRMENGLGLRARVIENPFGDGEFYHVIGTN